MKYTIELMSNELIEAVREYLENAEKIPASVDADAIVIMLKHNEDQSKIGDDRHSITAEATFEL